ncbi:MAG: hypothetical protein K2N74_02115 [Clostridiales bacterium]|nr:hypothetical protein [Clostridiales bacterium]
MKKYIPCVLLLLGLFPVLTACGGYDYQKHVSEIRSDLFCAETEEFSITLACISREYPYALDGVAAERSDLIEITLVPADKKAQDYTVTVLGEQKYGGEMSYRNVRGDYFYSQGVTEFPKDSVSLNVEWEGETREILATSVKNENTLSPNEALKFAVKHEKETVEKLTQNGSFAGEFHVRLLRREINYYYVGITDTNGNTIALLLNSETGDLLARREMH